MDLVGKIYVWGYLKGEGGGGGGGGRYVPDYTSEGGCVPYYTP